MDEGENKPYVVKHAEHEVESSNDNFYDTNEEIDDDAHDFITLKNKKPKNEYGVGRLK